VIPNIINTVKQLLKSRTVLVGLVSLLLGVSQFVEGHEFVKLYPEALAWFATISGLLGVALRVVTSLPVWEKKTFWGRK
jgi:hypothetical protein